MVEIFTVASGQQGAATRNVSNEIKLSAASDVYFGSAAAGIAYYEKSGADLLVTLLDGQEIRIRDFFVIGPQGQYSRLLDGGADGSVEVTGLIAPEPFVPPENKEETPVVTAAATPVSEPSDEPTDAQSNADTASASRDAGEQDSGGADADTGPVGTFAGVPLDGLLFGLAAIPSFAVILNSDKNTAPPPLGLARVAMEAQEDVPQDDSGEKPEMDADIAALLVGDEDSQGGDIFPGDDLTNSRAIGAEGHEGNMDLGSFVWLLDGFNPLPTEG